VTIQLDSLPQEVCEFDPKIPRNPATFFMGKAVLEVVESKAKKVWPECKSFSTLDMHRNPVVYESKVLEGSLVTVARLQIKVIVPQVLIDPSDPTLPLEFEMEFGSKANVKAIKGNVIKRLPPDLKSRVTNDMLVVMFDSVQLRNKDSLTKLDWTITNMITVTF
jgi:hypothetical protein